MCKGARFFALTPSTPLPKGERGGNAHQDAPPCAPTPLSHDVGEGLGVRASPASGLQTAAHGLQTTSHGLQTADAGLQTASHGLQTAGDGKPPSTGVAPCASNLYQSQGQSLQLPPSLRFPPLREGNRVGHVGSVPPACRGNLKELIRVHRLSSLCARRARFFALTPSPSPTLWERGVGAHGGAPCSAFPLSRRRERGTKGVRAIQRTCRFTLALGKIAPASKTSCRTVVPLPACHGGRGSG